MVRKGEWRGKRKMRENEKNVEKNRKCLKKMIVS